MYEQILLVYEQILFVNEQILLVYERILFVYEVYKVLRCLFPSIILVCFLHGHTSSDHQQSRAFSKHALWNVTFLSQAHLTTNKLDSF